MLELPKNTDDWTPEDVAALQAELDAMQAKTGPMRQPDHEKPYNYPDVWFMRQDGDIVRLQGTPQATKYYEDKGFHKLTPAEVRSWETRLRRLTVAQQNTKAALITTIRRIVDEHPKEISVDERAYPLDDYTADELEAKLAQIRESLPSVVVFSGPEKPSYRMQREQAQADERASAERAAMNGVETGDGDVLAGKRARGAGRTIPGGSVAVSQG